MVKDAVNVVEAYCVFTGHVQGVGFRVTTQRIALHLGLKGFVKNLPDGTVEVCTQGDRSIIDSLIEELQQKFFHSRVASIIYRNPTEKFSAFTIR